MDQKICLGILLLAASLTPCVAEDLEFRRDAVECTPRAGLPNFLAKVDAGQSVNVAYLGGSITAAGGWRVQSLAWFQEQYQQATFKEINAAIGGTGSDLGVFRLHNDVLRHHPDLMFVEFAVNDGGTSPEQIHRAMEGIVRQTWKADPSIDICFVYTLSHTMLSELRGGKMPRAANAMEDLADHYQIPSIHFGVNVVEMESKGELIFKAPKPAKTAEAKPMVFSTDGVHPHVETGHRLYTESIARSWPAIVDASREPQSHERIQPLRADNWEHAKQIPITADMLHGDWRKLSSTEGLGKQFNKYLPDLYQAMEPGATLEFTIQGTAASVFELLGPDGCELKLQVDDRQAKKQNSIDGYCTYHRLAKLAIASELEPGRHPIKVTVTHRKLDKREILFEQNRKFFDAHSDRYEDQAWYVGSLLVIGDVVPGDTSN
ncbi:SGNH/GDSL hydrolase family protein [Aureliella helgolandensis]|uniref:Multifunctional acyl-CoA thioesterase I and protease I and lysophospholipase L1 n=1 Tax=Aureliella helgolandensis TaxID=2527968 RepID=A0A518GAA0_9BACT|nr:SGNH/GDSL hydrolase family protein [Aureliella helgolandensis]QDV25500.1 multifunctional acyl-CoA thioesterase I and protease I and lysophospholipase L1 [Aureliella helgolandensis]